MIYTPSTRAPSWRWQGYIHIR